MSKETINCRGLDCPEPVIRTRRAIDASQPEEIMVIVDNKAALENVSRLLANKGFTPEHVEKDGLYEISARRAPGAQPDGGAAAGMKEEAQTGGAKSAVPAGQRTLVLISSQFFGSGDDDLGGRLMKNFLLTLPELGDDLWRLILVNSAVKLAVAGSPVLAELQKLESAGAGVLVCGACLEHFKLLESKAAGQTTNMLDVVTSMQLADKVLRI